MIRKPANIPVLGMSSHGHSLTSLLSASVLTSAEMSPTHRQQMFTTPVSEMTYTVSSGTLNPTIPNHCCKQPHSCISDYLH